jgi:sirohydrochlorin cobaltochelatase
MDAVILFSHGSVLCGAGEALDAHAERLRQTDQYPIVAIGYLNYSEPPFLQTVDEVVARGATRIIVVPYFLVQGYFVTDSLPKQIAKARTAHPGVEFVIGEALKQDGGLADALLDAAERARPSSEWRDPLRRAAHACVPRRDCPLYGTPACPKAPSLQAAATSGDKEAAITR